MTFKIKATLRHGSTILDGDMVEFPIERIAFDESMRDDIVSALNTLGAIEVNVVREIRER
jgi:hypothetical protein